MSSRPSFDFFYGIAFEEGENDIWEDHNDDENTLDFGELAEKYINLLVSQGKISAEEVDNTSYTDKVTELSGLVLDGHGYEWSGLFVGIKESHIHGDWDSIEVIPLDHMQRPYGLDDGEWDRKIAAFCEVVGIRKKTPQWLIVTSYS